MIQHQLVRLAFKELINQHILEVLEHPEKSFMGVGNASQTGGFLAGKEGVEYVDAAMFDPYPFGPKFNDDDFFLSGYWIFTKEEMANKTEHDYPWDKPFHKISLGYNAISLDGPPEKVVPKFIAELDYGS